MPGVPGGVTVLVEDDLEQQHGGDRPRVAAGQSIAVTAALTSGLRGGGQLKCVSESGANASGSAAATVSGCGGVQRPGRGPAAGAPASHLGEANPKVGMGKSGCGEAVRRTSIGIGKGDCVCWCRTGVGTEITCSKTSAADVD